MKKLTLVAGICMLACAFMGCSKKTEKGEFTVQKGKLTIGMEIGYPPFEYYAEDGKTPVGFDVELGTEIAKRLDLDAEFIDTAWDGIFAGLNTERYDVVISAATITPERVENFLFSNPYIGNGQAIIVRKDSNLKIKQFIYNNCICFLYKYCIQSIFQSIHLLHNRLRHFLSHFIAFRI